jgi:hypothetical protein
VSIQPYVPKALRERVAAQARQRCGYCLTTERITGAPMEIDHIIPHSLGGPTEEDNLWLACSMCNDHKGNQIAAPDPVTGEAVRLFDPRHQHGTITLPGRRKAIALSAKRRVDVRPCRR